VGERVWVCVCVCVCARVGVCQHKSVCNDSYGQLTHTVFVFVYLCFGMFVCACVCVDVWLCA